MADKIKPDHIRTVRISKLHFRTTWEYLRRRGRENLEGVTYWTGSAEPEAGVVSHVLFPAFYAAESAVHIEVDTGEVMRIANELARLDEFLLARVHSHPDAPFHSFSDDHGCLSGRVGMFSIVIPNFARGPPTLRGSAVYERMDDASWRLLPPDERNRRFRMI